MTDSRDIPRFYANLINLWSGPYDVTITFLEGDGTVLPEGVDGPHAVRITPVAQVVMSWGHAKAILPLIVKMIAQYEEANGEIPAPGFDQMSKE